MIKIITMLIRGHHYVNKIVDFLLIYYLCDFQNKLYMVSYTRALPFGLPIFIMYILYMYVYVHCAY